MNKVILTGTLVRDIEKVETAHSVFARGCVASTRSYKDKEGKTIVDFIEFIAFGQCGNYLINYGTKGCRVEIIGRIEIGEYAVGDKKIKRNNVCVDQVAITQFKAKEETQADENVEDDSTLDETCDDDMPF